MTIKISELGNITVIQGNTFVPAVSNITGVLTTVKSTVDQLKTFIVANAEANILAANAATIFANTVMKGYVDGQITAANAGVTAANLGVVGYVNLANTIQSAQIASANLGIIGYVDNSVSTANIAMKGYVDSVASQSIYGNANVAAYLHTNNYNPYSNVNVAVFTNLSTYAYAANVTAANLGMKGYVDNSVSTANIGMKGYVDSVANQSIYGNANVASYLHTYNYNPYSNVNVAVFTNLSTYAYNANVTSANLGIIGYVDNSVSTANIGMKGYVDNAVSGAGSYGNIQVATYLPTYTGNVAAGNVKVSTAYRFETGNVTITNESGYVSLTPDTALSGTAGVKIGGSGYLLGPNGARNLTLNYGSISGALGIQANVTIGTGGSGNLFVLGNVIARDITGGNILATGTSGVVGFNGGGFVQQATSNATQVTSNTTSGNIQLMSIDIGAHAVHTVTFACNKLTTNDLLLIQHINGGLTSVYVDAYVVSDGLGIIWLRDITGNGTGAFTPMLKYAIIRAPSA